MKRTYFIIGLSLTVAALVASLVLYPQLPDRIPTHWNIYGQADHYGAKCWAAFFGLGVMALLLVLFRLLPWLSPRHFEVDTFRSTYLFIMLVILTLLAYVHGLALWAVLAKPIEVGRAVVAGIFLVFALIGNVLGKVQRNFYIGVRTPWTIANERVWNATHRFAARLFVAVGLLGFVATILAGWTVVSLIVLMAAVVASIVYSLVYYKRLERRGEV